MGDLLSASLMALVRQNMEHQNRPQDAVIACRDSFSAHARILGIRRPGPGFLCDRCSLHTDILWIYKINRLVTPGRDPGWAGTDHKIHFVHGPANLWITHSPLGKEIIFTGSHPCRTV